MIKMRRAQLSFGDGLIHEEVEDLREDWMTYAEQVLVQSYDDDFGLGPIRAYKHFQSDPRCQQAEMESDADWSYWQLHHCLLGDLAGKPLLEIVRGMPQRVGEQAALYAGEQSLSNARFDADEDGA